MLVQRFVEFSCHGVCMHLAKCFEGASSKDANKNQGGKFLTFRAPLLKIYVFEEAYLIWDLVLSP